MAHEGIAFPNGVRFSPDHAFLTVSDTLGRWVWSFQVQPDGTLVNGALGTSLPALTGAVEFGDWWFFLQLGALAAVFMYLMAQAYSRAEAQQLAPIHYTELLYASVIGFVIFHETPRVQIYLGATLIIAACLWAAYDERRLALKPKENAS